MSTNGDVAAAFIGWCVGMLALLWGYSFESGIENAIVKVRDWFKNLLN